MNLAWLEDFLAVAATGNFSRAAELRHMTQPAFSRRVRALEDWLGAPLFDRSVQPARPTPVGEWLLPVARSLLAEVDRLPAAARALAQADAATLRFAATHALSFTFLPGWLRALESRVALGPVQLVSDGQPRCEALLRQGQVQFVLGHAHPGVRGPLDEAGCPSVAVGADRLLPVSAPGADRQALLSYGESSGLGRILRRLRAPAGQVVFTAELASVLRTMALDRRGLAWLPESLVVDDLASGRLAVDDGAPLPLEIRLHRERGPLPPAAEAFWAAAGGAPAS